MNAETPAYGLWALVIINTAVFIIFAFSFTHPRSGRDWRSFGAFSAFLVALFTEMYGFPLTLYLLSGWLGSRYPEIDLLTHNSGHLWSTLLGWQGDAHFSPLHLLSYLFIGGGFTLLSAAWNVLYRAQRESQLATTGPYAYLRHPQYAGFTLILLGFLLQWPTLLTLLMFPVLVVMYMRLARREEREALAEFGEAYASYAANVPGFFPRRPQIVEDGIHEVFGGTEMDENCEVKPLHKKVTAEEYQKTRLALLAVTGMGCPSCAARVHNSLIALNGVTNAIVDHITGNARITFNPDMVAFPALLEAVAQAGNDGRHAYRATTMNTGW